jgi:hypothetical protein
VQKATWLWIIIGARPKKSEGSKLTAFDHRGSPDMLTQTHMAKYKKRLAA